MIFAPFRIRSFRFQRHADLLTTLALNVVMISMTAVLLGAADDRSRGRASWACGRSPSTACRWG